ncbi:hypothetical protein HDU76_010222 [Blyttiomyces sp. JEL0837]|nr:hypothetical protein HDU76_010222 [Blyttiomyces sp. JEL0837]
MSGLKRRPLSAESTRSVNDVNIDLGRLGSAQSASSQYYSHGVRAPKRTTKFNQKLTVFPGEPQVYEPPSPLPTSAISGDLQFQVPTTVGIVEDVNVAKSPIHATVQQEEDFLQKVDKESLPRVTAYCTANSYKMDRLMEYLISRKFLNATAPKRFDEVIYTPYGVAPAPGGDSCDFIDGEKDGGPVNSFGADKLEDDQDSTHTSFLASTDSENFPRSRTPRIGDVEKISISRTKVTYADLVRKTTVPELFFFDYGVVVMWGLTEEEEAAILKEIQVFQEDTIDSSELEPEQFRYLYSKQQKPRIYNDIITLVSPKASVMIKLSISHACAQSAKLTLFEGLVEETIEHHRHIPRVLAETGKIHLSRFAVNQTIGKLFLMRTNVNLVSNVLDTPDIFWSQPALEPLYRAIRGYLEISQRVDLINQRVNVISEMMTMLQNNVNLTHGEVLEWIVIILIALELGIGIATIAIEFAVFSRQTVK